MDDNDKTTIKVIKILFVGSLNSGKSNLIRLIKHGFFSEYYKTTIAVDFVTKEYKYNDELTISLQFWDIASCELYSSLTRAYYRGASAAFVVFNVADMESLNIANEWKNEIDKKVHASTGFPIPCVLLGNKFESCNSKIGEDTIRIVSHDNGYVDFFEVNERNINELDIAVHELIDFILLNEIEPSSIDRDQTYEPKDFNPHVKRICTIY